MKRLPLLFLSLAVFQLASPVPAGDEVPEVEPVATVENPEETGDWGLDGFDDDDDDDSSRSIWDKAFPPAFNVLKKVLRVEPLKCQHTTCSSCMAAFNKGGCFTVDYNRQAGPKATLSVELKSMRGRKIFGGSINAGKPIPSCVNLQTPMKHVCLQDFTAAVGDSAIPTGDLCFTINFRDYHLGVRFCALFTYGSFVPVVWPNIVKT